MTTTPTFIDTHCHLDMLELEVHDAIHQASLVNVSPLITISVDVKSIAFVNQVVQEHEGVYGSVGLHPHEASHYSAEVEAQIRQFAESNPSLIAIGETGLDYHYMHSEASQQQHAFERQLQLASELKLPVVLHTREAEEDTLAILRNADSSIVGVAHSFTGSLEMAKALIEMGWYIGVNGIITFKRADDLREVLQHIPLDRLLLETDSPFLTPVPMRGKPNDPSKIPYIAEFVANELNISLEALSEQTNQNVERLFGVVTNCNV